MLFHIVCWKYKPETAEAAREEHREQLRALVGVIPEIIGFDVGADILHLERSFDTGLTSTFLDREALDRYIEHWQHQKVAALGREISEKIISVDFVSGA